MSEIGLFFGTQTSNTQTAAEMIQQELGGESVVELIDVAQAEPTDFEEFDKVIIGCPTWNVGEMQSDWEDMYEELDEIDFSGKQVAYFGEGDQAGYPDSFQDAMGMLEDKISNQGGETVGYWSTEGYDFEDSKALKNDKFVGLALDEDNQSDLTEERIKFWASQLKQEFDL